MLIAHKVQANLVCDTGAGLSEGPPQKRAKDNSWSTVAGKAKSTNAGSAVAASAAAATGSGPSPADLKQLASENKPSAQLFGYFDRCTKCGFYSNFTDNGGSSQGGRSPEVCRFVHTRPMDLGLEAQSSRGRGTTVRMWHTAGGEGRAFSLAGL